MKNGLQVGSAGTLDLRVGGAEVIHLGSHQKMSAVVFATPSMINLMEYAARKVLAQYLEDNEESVGVNVHVEHLAATPINAIVRAEARVTAIEKRLIDFDVAVFDEREQIGKGTHRRAVVSMDRLVAKLQEKTKAMKGSVPMSAQREPNSGELSKLSTLLVQRDGAVLTVTLNRPQKLNAVDQQMTSDLEKLNCWLAGHPDVRVVIVTGAGEAFCAGDDVKEVGTLDLVEATKLSHRQAELYLEWERLPQVFIAAVNGAAFGGGCVCAYSCDFRIAAHSARFGMPEVLLGWPPGYGLAQLTALIGKARALELCLTGKQITAQQAMNYGLANDIVPLGRVISAAQELARELIAQPARALSLTKQLLYMDEGMVPKVAYLADTAAYIECLGQPDAREGIAAFNAKRKAKFGSG
jgi:enoyl-CoA hydratase